MRNSNDAAEGHIENASSAPRVLQPVIAKCLAEMYRGWYPILAVILRPQFAGAARIILTRKITTSLCG